MYRRLAIHFFPLDNMSHKVAPCDLGLHAVTYKEPTMPKLNETFARKTAHPTDGTEKHWDTEVCGLVLFVGKRSKTWYFQKDVGGQTRRVLIGRYPIISAEAERSLKPGLF